MTEPTALWVTPVSNMAGVARHFLDAARVGVPGWQMQFVCPPGPLQDHLRSAGHTVHSLDLEQPVPRVVADLRTILRSVNPQIAHSHLAKADFLLAMASPGLPCTLVSTEHHIPEDPLVFHGTKLRALSRQLAHHVRSRRFAHLIAVSESTKRDIQKYWRTPTPVTVVLNGVDRPREPIHRTPGLRVVSLTRLSHEKNLDMTLRGFSHILHKRPTATLTIGGEGEEAERLKSLARELQIGHATTFVGFVDAEEAMRTHDVLLQPSKADNLSYTLLDAVNAGMGVVATAIGGNPEILPPRALVQLGDDRGLAESAIRQGENVGERPTLPATIPTVAEMTRQVADVYASLPARRSPISTRSKDSA